MDVVSDVIETMRTGRPSSSRLSIGRPWCCRFAPYDGAGFHVLLRGSGWLVPDRGEPVPLGAGDVVFVPHGRPHVLSDSPSAEGAVPFEAVASGAVASTPGDPVEFLCGKYRLDRSRMHPLLAGMPDVVHLPARAGEYAPLRAAVDLLGAEVLSDRPGGETLTSSLLDVLLVYMMRAWLEDDAGAGWPRALRDPQIAAALEAMHARPAAPWRIEDLAAHVGLSRATLARRFTALTGRSPIAYLTWWRMTTAARLLRRSDLPLLAIARQVGYGSPYAFSHAFKRQFGVPPGTYRAQRPPPGAAEIPGSDLAGGTGNDCPPPPPAAPAGGRRAGRIGQASVRTQLPGRRKAGRTWGATDARIQPDRASARARKGSR